MFENVGRKIALIVILLLVSVGLMIFPKQPFRLGLDLQGGTRIVYRFDFAAARASGQISPAESDHDILMQAVGIIRSRVDPTGTRDVPIRAEGTDRIVIELPGSAAVEGTAELRTALTKEIDDVSQDALELADTTGFSPSGIVQIDEEHIRYSQLDGKTLKGLKRGHQGRPAPHAANATVRLVNSDAIRAAIENLGDLAFALVAEDRDFAGKDTDLQNETTKLQTWRTSNPTRPVVDFNLVAPEQGGPDPSIRWYPTRWRTDDGETVVGEPTAVLKPRTPEEKFSGQDLQRIFNTSDSLGWPAVGFEIRADRIGDFADFTGDNVNRRMAIVLNDEVRSSPTLQSKLVGSGIIEGRFQDAEAKDLVTVLRSGSLKLKPKLEHDERVGPTLGQDYVNRGLWSSVLAMALVLAFMIVYYRRLGVYSALALLTNMIMFMGGLAFLQATLTLPGIAGIVLTIGMAVDANILIFDRLREEAEKGRNPKQAAKAGFENALSAIIDANVTTFLTALILYKLGTGPVRGFAVTLMIGVLSSVFAALVTTRVFVHWALARGTQRFRMGRWMADANYDFLGKTKYMVALSLFVCIGGLAVFLARPAKEKLGIDFTGGAEAQLETAKPESIDTMRARVAALPVIGESAEVKPVLNSAQDDGYTQFRVQFKAFQEATEEGDESSEQLRPKLQEGLKDVLLSDPIAVTLFPESESSRAEVELLFGLPPSPQEVKTRLEGVGLTDVEVAAGTRLSSFTARGNATAGRDAVELRRAIEVAFAPPDDNSFALAQGIPNYAQVGPQVVGELRDKALLALAVSLFVTVIYIRVRFAEYSYGIAAMVALVHDVLVSLAALTIGNWIGIVNGEINLAMIAVFLTIIGYSVNDTIVIFDRVRENLPKSNLPLRDLLNQSLNETLSRTIMTSLTVFLAIIVQYLFNVGTGNVLESISYAMIFGTISGVYSTIYIANPIFLWLETRSQKKRTDGGAHARALRSEERKRLERERKEEGEDEAAAVKP